MSINGLIDKSVCCALCGSPSVGTCKCWARCACGRSYEAEGRCPGRAHGELDPWFKEVIDIYAELVGASGLSAAACRCLLNADLLELFSMGYAPDEAISMVLSSRP